MFESGIDFLKKLKDKAKKVRTTATVLGSVAVFSPLLVACYGPPMDDFCEPQYDCIDGYVRVCNVERTAHVVDKSIDSAAKQICTDNGAGSFHWVNCSATAQYGIVDSGETCDPNVDTLRDTPTH